ncbi:serine dehydrogenasease [bacterium AH-315-J23]|nr:serine dehydrogenasease [bacterium AH-315-J23]PHQ66574.1 MAG: serine dehydrogenasease [Robiginitomaculum sp.]
MDTIKVEGIVTITLSNANADLAKQLSADVILINSPIVIGLDDLIRDEIESIRETNQENNKLAVLLETTGGYIEVVERIVSVFRRHYDEVVFIIPNSAYSAGTVLALSGDDIMMDYYSVLGPIDPQFQTENGDQVPGMGYIQKFKELSDAINKPPDGDMANVRAETAYLLKKFDPAKLFHIEQAIEHSKELIRDWLPMYKFKNWTTRKSSGDPVTEELKSQRAESIAEILGDAKHWHSHGRGISMTELASDKIGLQITDFGIVPDLNANVRHYHGLFSDYINKVGYKGGIHSPRGIRRTT